MSGRHPGDEPRRGGVRGYEGDDHYDRRAGYEPDDERRRGRRRAPAHEPTQWPGPDEGAGDDRGWAGPDSWPGQDDPRRGANRGRGWYGEPPADPYPWPGAGQSGHGPRADDEAPRPRFVPRTDEPAVSPGTDDHPPRPRFVPRTDDPAAGPGTDDHAPRPRFVPRTDDPAAGPGDLAPAPRADEDYRDRNREAGPGPGPGRGRGSGPGGGQRRGSGDLSDLWRSADPWAAEDERGADAGHGARRRDGEPAAQAEPYRAGPAAPRDRRDPRVYEQPRREGREPYDAQTRAYRDERPPGRAPGGQPAYPDQAGYRGQSDRVRREQRDYRGHPGYQDTPAGNRDVPGYPERRPAPQTPRRDDGYRGADAGATQEYQDPVVWTDRGPRHGAQGPAGAQDTQDTAGRTDCQRAGGRRQAPPAGSPASGQGERAWWDDAFRPPAPGGAARPRTDRPRQDQPDAPGPSGRPGRPGSPGQQRRPRPSPAQGYGLPPGELTQPIPVFQPQGAFIAPDAYDEDGYTVAYAPSRPYLRERALREREPRAGEAPAGPSLARSTGSMALGTLISRVTGFLRTFVFVFALGATQLANAYNVANTIPNAVYDIVIGGVLTSVVVPLLVKAAKEHRDSGEAYDQRIFTLSVLALGAVTVVATISAALLIDIYASSVHGTEHRLMVVFAYFFIPQIFFYGMSSLMGAILNTRNSFAAPMWTPIINNVVVIAVGLLFVVTIGLRKSPENIPAAGVVLLGVGTTLGIVTQTLALVPALRQVGFRWRPRFDFRRDELAEIGRMAIWMFGYVLSTGTTFVVTTNVAVSASVHVPDAGVSAYNYSYSLFLLPYAIIGVSVTTALLPRMSRHAAEGNFELVSEDFSYSIRLSSVILVPAALLLAVLGPALCEFLFSYGSSSAAEARYIGEAFGAFSLGLLPFVIFQLQLRVFYALHDSRTPAIIGFWTMAATIAGNFLALAVLPPGEVVIGMAFVYGITSVFSAAIGWRLLNRRTGSLEGRVVTRSLVRMHVASIPGVVFAFAVSAGVATVFHPGAVYGFVTTLIGGGGALLLYLVMAKALRVAELSQVMRMVLGRFGGRAQQGAAR